jgi:hypothetical protein
MSSWLALAVLAALFPSAVVAGRAPKDHVWTRSDASRFPAKRITLLPVVSMNYQVGLAVGEQWLLHFIDDGHDWIPPEVCARSLSAMSPRKPDSIARMVNFAVFKRGCPDTLQVPSLTRRLQSQAVLSVRVDRWERVVESDARITTAHIGLTAALVDSAGHVLWQISGEQAQIAKYGIPQAVRGAGGIGGGTSVEVSSGGKMSTSGQLVSAPSYSTMEAPGGGPGYTAYAKSGADLAPDFQAALSALLDRWRHTFPFLPPVATGSSRAP